MAQIPQINNPITAKNYNYSSRPMDPNTEPFDIVRLTSVSGSGNSSGSGTRSRLEMGNRELIPLTVQVAKDPTMAVETLEDLLNIEVLNQALITGHTELYGKLENLAKELYVTPDELVREIQNQEQQNTMFSGHEFYDVLREVAKTTTDPTAKELIGNLLKSINFAQNKNEILGALRANMKFLSEYFSPNEKLSSLLMDLSKQWGAKDADKYFDYLKSETLGILNDVSGSLLNDDKTQMLIPLIVHNLSRYNNSPYMCKEYFNLLMTRITSGTLRESLRNSFSRLYSALFEKQPMKDPQGTSFGNKGYSETGFTEQTNAGQPGINHGNGNRGENIPMNAGTNKTVSDMGGTEDVRQNPNYQPRPSGEGIPGEGGAANSGEIRQTLNNQTVNSAEVQQTLNDQPANSGEAQQAFNNQAVNSSENQIPNNQPSNFAEAPGTDNQTINSGEAQAALDDNGGAKLPAGDSSNERIISEDSSYKTAASGNQFSMSQQENGRTENSPTAGYVENNGEIYSQDGAADTANENEIPYNHYTTNSPQNQPLTGDSDNKNLSFLGSESDIQHIDKNQGDNFVENDQDLSEEELTGYRKFLFDSMSEKGFTANLKKSGYNIEKTLAAYTRGKINGADTIRQLIKGLFIDDKSGKQYAEFSNDYSKIKTIQEMIDKLNEMLRSMPDIPVRERLYGAFVEVIDRMAVRSELPQHGVRPPVSSTLDNLTDFIQENINHPALKSLDSFNAANLLQSLLNAPGVFTPLAHYILPLDAAGTKAFGELWVDNDENNPNNTPGTQRNYHLFLTFDIESIGRFEVDMYALGEDVNLALLYPPRFEKQIDPMKERINKIIRNIGYNTRAFETAPLREPHNLTEIFPKIMDKRATLNKRV